MLRTSPDPIVARGVETKMVLNTRSSTDLPLSHRDLLEAPGVAVLATVGADNQPQLTAVWYLLDDDGLLKVSVRTDRQKVKNLARRAAATFFVTDPTRFTRTLEVRATAELAADEDYRFADRLGRKYGTDMRSLDQAGDSRLIVTLHPHRVNFRG